MTKCCAAFVCEGTAGTVLMSKALAARPTALAMLLSPPVMLQQRTGVAIHYPLKAGGNPGFAETSLASSWPKA